MPEVTGEVVLTVGRVLLEDRVEVKRPALPRRGRAPAARSLIHGAR
jgi:hypothetical protein